LPRIYGLSGKYKSGGETVSFNVEEKIADVNAGHANRGFTLIEVVVVSVIVLVLAAVSIPIYNGYVEGARREAVNNLAQTAAAAASSYYKKTGTDPTTFTPNAAPLSLFYAANKFTVSRTGSYIVVSETGRSPNLTTSVLFK
jgi:type IV pilus assembly protein PilE